MKRIPLTQGKFTLVDDQDFDLVSRFSWYTMRSYETLFYARAVLSGRSRIFMHRLILDAPNGLVVDHVNRDGLDNRRTNIRICTMSENMRNQTRHRDGSSKFKGVSWDQDRGKWRASLRVNGKTYNLGRYFSEEKAAMAYDKFALEQFGEFARVNLKED